MPTQNQLSQNIKDLREQMVLSQQELADAVGLSRPAVSEIERGNRSVDAVELANIARFFGVSMEDLLSPKKKAPLIGDKRNKKIEFKPEKLRQLILYVLSKCGGKPNVGETVLYKLLYFIDFDAYESIGKPVTGMDYVHFQYGPVPVMEQYLKVVEDMKDSKQLRVINQEYFGMIQKRYIALDDARLGEFSIQEKEVVDSVIVKLSDMNANQIEEYVHHDAPWMATKYNEVIPYNLVVDRTAPYSSRDVDKAWQDAAAMDTIKELGEMSEDEYNYYQNL